MDEQLAPASVAAPAAPVAAASAPASAASAASSKAAQQQQPQPQPQPALVAAYPQSHPQQLQLQHPQHQHFAHLPAAYPLQQQQQPQPPPQQQQQSFLAPFAASAQPAMFAYPAQFYPVPTTSNQQSTNTGKQRFPSSYPQNSASAGAQNRQSQNRYTVPVQQPLDFTAQLSQQQVPNIQQRDPMQLYSMPTILPNLAVPPLFSNTLAAEYASTANAAGASVLTPEMTWSRVDLPAFVWFELYVRAGAVLSAAAVARELPEGGTFFGWQGQVGVVAPDLMWEAVRDSLARCIPFAQPSAAGQSNHAYSPSNAAPASPSVSTKPATAASTNWGNSGNQSQPSDTVSSIGPLPKVSPLAPVGAAAPPNQNPPTGSSAKNVQKQQHQRPISSQSSHSREADANTSAVSRKSSNNSLAHHNVVMVPNPAARSRHSISSQQSQQQPPSVSGTKLYALDAMDVPIPALVNLPQQFLKDMEDAFGGVRAFCYHVTGPESARVCVAKRGDGFGAGSKALTPK
ncbi:hypothetical protein HDU83_006936 [Entophlyctis luteolus]|nr:hypothetical protein HDU83_006936 [Entophlyctis luteolus]